MTRGLLVCVALLTSACGQPLTSALTRVVQVRELGTNLPVAQVHVSIFLNDRSASPAGETEANGRFVFTAQSDVGFTATLTKFGYLSQSITIARAADTPVLPVWLIRSAQ